MDSTPTRRAMLGALASLPATGAFAAPALAMPSGATPFAITYGRYLAAQAVLNASPDHLETSDPATFKALEDRYCKALNAVDDATPTSWREFTQKLEATIADGCTPGAELCNRLIAEAKRLVAGGLN